MFPGLVLDIPLMEDTSVELLDSTGSLRAIKRETAVGRLTQIKFIAAPQRPRSRLTKETLHNRSRIAADSQQNRTRFKAASQQIHSRLTTD